LASLCWIRYSYHSYIGEVTWCGIFWWFCKSFSSLSSQFSYFFRWVWHLFCDLDYYPHMLGLLAIDYSCTFHLFPTRWSPYFLVDHLHKQEFALLLIIVPSNIMWTHFRSCLGLGADMWLLARPTTPAFHLSLAHFLITLRTYLGLPHPMVSHLS